MDTIKDRITKIEKELYSLNKEHQEILNSLNRNIEVLSKLVELQNDFKKRSDILQKEIESLQLQSTSNEFLSEVKSVQESIAITERNEQNLLNQPLSKTITANIEKESVSTENSTECKRAENCSTETTIYVTESTLTTHNESEIQQEKNEKEFQDKINYDSDTKDKEENFFNKVTTSLLNEVKKDWEKFIGENLISKIGILIIIIGVAIGGKYAIDNQLISPAARIIIGTLIGLGLEVFSIKLKNNYKNFSAVLSGGSLAILYFMIYFAYDFYALIPMPLAFLLMVIVTGYTIHSAWKYDNEIIAILGQIGAYVVPFLLSSGNGNTEVLLAYIAIINIGVMIVSSKKYWKIVLALAFFASWSILAFSYRATEITTSAQAWTMLLFMLMYFLTFYAAFVLYKVCKCQFFKHFDITYILTNSFFFFGLGYNLMMYQPELTPYIELFALFNACIHFIVALVLYKKQLVDKNLRLLITGVGLLFVTLAIAICFTGHWITLFWMLEMTLLFALGRIKKQYFYERMSYPILLLAIVSLLADWGNPHGTDFGPLNFLAEIFTEWRSLWDCKEITITEKRVIPWFSTLTTILLGGTMIYIDERYPIATTKKRDTNNSKKWSKIIKITTISIITAAAFVHLESPWYIVAWSIEAAILFQVGSTKNSVSLKNSSLIVITLSILFDTFFLFDISEFEINENNSYYQLYEWLPTTISSIAIIIALLFIIHRWNRNQEDINNSIYQQTTLRYILSIFLIFSTFVLSTTLSIEKLQEYGSTIFSQNTETIVGLILFYLFAATRNDAYKKMFKIPIIIAFTSLIFNSTEVLKPVLFFSNLFFCGSVAFMIYTEIKQKKEEMGIFLPLIFIFAFYLTLRQFIECTSFSTDNKEFVLICYSLFYFSIGVILVNKYHLPKMSLLMTILQLVIIMSCISQYFIISLDSLEGFLMNIMEEETTSDSVIPTETNLSLSYLFLRYMTFGFTLLSTYIFYTIKKKEPLFKAEFYDLFSVLIVLAIGSIEIYWIMNKIGMENYYKIAMSIYWGLISLLLVYYGLFKNIKHLRITGIAIFAVTLIKIFFIDLDHLSTFAKAILFVSMGILLLVASFFYQKIAKEQEKKIINT